jgi:hypothetical protein
MLNDTYGALWDIKLAVYWATVNGTHFSFMNPGAPSDQPTSFEAHLRPILPPGRR